MKNNIVRTKDSARGGVTEDEKKKLKLHADLWIERIMRTAPINPDKIIPAIEGLYEVSGLKKPRVVIVPSPLMAAFVYGAASTILKNDLPGYASKHIHYATRDATRDANCDATRDATDYEIDRVIYVATNRTTRDATYEATRDATVKQIDYETRASIHDATDYKTRDQLIVVAYNATYNATRAATRAATLNATDDATFDATLGSTGYHSQQARQVHDATRDATRGSTTAAISNVTDIETRDATRVATNDAIDDATLDVIYNEILDVTNDATRDVIYNETSDATRNATRNAIDVATHDVIYNATDAVVRNTTQTAAYIATFVVIQEATVIQDATFDATVIQDATYNATRDATYNATDHATHVETFDATYIGSDIIKTMKQVCFDLTGVEGLEAAKKYYNVFQGGNMWGSYDCYLTAFRDVIGLELPVYEKYKFWEDAAVHGGPRLMHKDFCIVSDFPEILMVDEENRPHCENGPSHRWRDGWSLYHWHGVKVPAHWIENRASVDVSEIIACTDVEQRAAGAAIVGWPRLMAELGCVVVDHDPNEDHGDLIEMTLPGLSTPGRFLRAMCPRNGLIVEGVPRLSDIDGSAIDTVLAAQAWRVGKTPETFNYPERRT